MCPECGSFDLRAVPFDFGVDSETGYADAGAQFACRSCGATGDAADADAACEQSERAALRNVRKPAASAVAEMREVLRKFTA